MASPEVLLIRPVIHKIFSFPLYKSLHSRDLRKLGQFCSLIHYDWEIQLKSIGVIALKLVGSDRVGSLPTNLRTFRKLPT